MKVLLLSRYGRLGASSRIRSYQYLPSLETQGIHVAVSPLFEDTYLHGLYSGRSVDVRSVVEAYSRRVRCILQGRQFDLVWIEYEVLPWLPPWPERFLAKTKTPYVVDYDDAIYHRYDMHPSRVIRWLLGRKIDVIMRKAAQVIVGNQYLDEWALKSGVRYVALLSSVVDLDPYSCQEGKVRHVFSFGCSGYPTIATYLNFATPAIEEFAGGRKVKEVLVGSGKAPINSLPAEMREWSEEVEVKDIKDFDAGIMPLPDDPRSGCV